MRYVAMSVLYIATRCGQARQRRLYNKLVDVDRRFIEPAADQARTDGVALHPRGAQRRAHGRRSTRHGQALGRTQRAIRRMQISCAGSFGASTGQQGAACPTA